MGVGEQFGNMVMMGDVCSGCGHEYGRHGVGYNGLTRGCLHMVDEPSGRGEPVYRCSCGGFRIEFYDNGQPGGLFRPEPTRKY